ncbi:hypothetical protein [Microvirga makkahensis]|uniref:Uncharacterized protein n=1 Tax=Microvirga makkahensis TaxID=1128670 RepID=A0A7X3MTW0_9HYPH|nr:hypothetical protein [Microvirga makkahensis]MXQ13005.1 hypothetical protein [Microvirga makkahensis]
MNPQTSHQPSYGTDDSGYGQARGHVRSSFCIMPHTPHPGRNASFIFGRSDSRIRPLLNQEERDRLHCWSMIIALASSAAGTTLLLTAFLH